MTGDWERLLADYENPYSIIISWREGEYRVSEPGDKTGEYVPVEMYKGLLREFKRLVEEVGSREKHDSCRCPKDFRASWAESMSELSRELAAEFLGENK